MHAKMTRDRKKCYIASIKRVITKLEDQNQHLRDTLEKSQALSAIDNQSEDSPGETSVSSGHKNLEASATALGARGPSPVARVTPGHEQRQPQ